MEIDFLGLSSKHEKEQQNSNYSFTDSGDEISLSLSTTSQLNYQKEVFDFPENTRKSHIGKTISACSSGSSSTTFCTLTFQKLENVTTMGQPFTASSKPFLHPMYDLNDRNLSELSASPALTRLYSNVTNDTLSEKASTRHASDAVGRATGGYSPTVAMARKATLARFLEKRLDRLTKTRKSFLMGKLLEGTNSEAGNTNCTSHNKKSIHRCRS